MRNLYGFTLIELIIVLVISSTFLGIGYGRYQDFARRQEILNTKREMVSDFREAQKNAVSGNKNEACTTSLEGYFIEITQFGSATQPAEYDIYSRCENSATQYDLETVTLGPNVTLSVSDPSFNPLIFRPLALGTNVTAGSNQTITISNQNISGTTTLLITQTGEIE